MYSRTSLLFLVTSLVAWFACAPPLKTPSLIVSVDKKELSVGEVLTLSIQVKDFTLSKADMGRQNQPGQGHYRVFLDDEMSNHILAAADSKAPVKLPNDIKAGSHSLLVRLYNNDYSEFNPTTEQKVSFTVKEKGAKPRPRPRPKPKKPTLTAKILKTTFTAGQTFKLSVKVENFVVVDPSIYRKNEDGLGHYKVYLDDKVGKDTLAESYEEEIEIQTEKTLKPGKHNIRIIVVRNEGQELSPKLEAKLSFDVLEPKPILIAKANKKELHAGQLLTLTISTENFELSSQNIGKANKKNQGHYRVYLDKKSGKDYLASNAIGFLLLNIDHKLKPGKHEIKVVLLNNDATPLKPKVEQIIKLTIKSKLIPKVSLLTRRDYVSPGQRVPLSFNAVENFSLVDYRKKRPNQWGEGHYKIYLDNISSKSLSRWFARSVNVKIPKATSLGAHKLIVLLVNNDGSPLNPQATSEVTIQVIPTTVSTCTNLYKQNVGCKTFENRTHTSSTRTIGTSRNTYAPKCLMIRAGQKVQFQSTFITHPLRQSCGAANVISYTNVGEIKSFTFKKAGYYGFYCTRHGTPIGQRMAGAIWVLPANYPSLSVKVNSSSIFRGKQLPVSILVQNFKLKAYQKGTQKKNGEGHYLVYIETSKGKNLVASGHTPKLRIKISKALPIGKSTLWIELVNNDKTPFNPPVQVSQEFVIEKQLVKCSSLFTTNVKCGSSYTDRTQSSSRRVSFGGMSYNPKCIKIKKGQTIEFRGTFSSHPLKAACGDDSIISYTNTGSLKKFTFKTPGYYGYFCTRHGTVSGRNMAGMIWVTP